MRDCSISSSCAIYPILSLDSFCGLPSRRLAGYCDDVSEVDQDKKTAKIQKISQKYPETRVPGRTSY